MRTNVVIPDEDFRLFKSKLALEGKKFNETITILVRRFNNGEVKV